MEDVGVYLSEAKNESLTQSLESSNGPLGSAICTNVSETGILVFVHIPSELLSVQPSTLSSIPQKDGLKYKKIGLEIGCGRDPGAAL